MGSIDLPRPLTHDLFINILKEVSINIERIEINDLTDATFYARVIARQGKKKLVFDSRPSDAIAIAIRAECPVYIAEYIVDEASIPTSIIGDAEKASTNKSVLEELRRTLEVAVEEENYEVAAKIRDRIREMEDGEAEDEAVDIDEGVLSFFEDIIEANDPVDFQDEEDDS